MKELKKKLKQAKKICEDHSGLPTCRNCFLDFDELLKIIEDKEGYDMDVLERLDYIEQFLNI